MDKIEISKLFERINNHYNTFTRSEGKIDEWYRFLKDYDSKEVNCSFDEYIACGYDNPPLIYSITKNLKKVKEQEEYSWITKCNICDQEIQMFGNDWTKFDKHYRKCSKIDFIDRIVFRYKGQHIASVKYYEMSDEELEENYRKTMEYYLKHKNTDVKILKTIPEEEY